MSEQAPEGSDEYRGVDPSFMPVGEADEDESASAEKAASGDDNDDPGQPVTPGNGE